MLWTISNRADPVCRLIADRHYNRQKVGSDQFVPPGRCLVLYAKTKTGQALWVTSWPEFARHEWPGAWVCSLFRNEGAGVASRLIEDAVSCTKYVFGNPPKHGMITFIDSKKVKPIKIRGKESWGRTYKLAGFNEIGKTKVNKLLVFQLPPEKMPGPKRPLTKFEFQKVDE